MADLGQINLLDLIPSSISGDETVKAAAEALTDELNTIAGEASNTLLFSRLDELEEPILTHLAYQLKVEFWDADLSDEEKRNLIRGSIAWHKIKGTPEAIAMIGAIVFDTMEMLEWFDYGGIPTHFKLKTRDHVQNAEFYTRLFDLVDIAKNARSFLEAVIIAKEKNGSVHVGGAVRQATKIKLYTYAGHSASAAHKFIGSAVRVASKKTIIIQNFKLNLTGSSQNYAGGAVRVATKLKIGV